jgi:hypothetical protein
MLDTDPPGGLLLARRLVDGDLLGWRVLARFGWWGVDLVGERLGKALVAAVTVAVTVGCWRSRSSMPSVLTAVWSCIRPGRTAPAHRVRP